MAISQGLTLEEFLELPEEKPALEFADGTVTQKVSPRARHSIHQGELVERINRFAKPPKLAYAFPELRASFGGTSAVPDVSVFLWERISRDSTGEPLDDVFVAPDIAIGIASPGQTVRDLADRRGWYVANGVQLSILVRPNNRSLTAFRPGVEPTMLRGADLLEFGPVLPGFGFTVDELFDAASLR